MEGPRAVRQPRHRLRCPCRASAAASRFLNAPDWVACKGDAADLTGARCYLGLDLSSTTDLTALVAFFPETGDLLSWFWAPADTLEDAERRDHVPYRLWARQDFLETTPGRAIDKGFIVRRLADIAAEFKVIACAYDRWGMPELMRIMGDEGVKMEMVEFGQGWKDMAPALNAVEKLVLQGELRHDGHPVMTWCVSNAIAISDPAGNRKLAKDRSTGRIDGLVAAAMACGLAARTPAKKPSVYATRGLLVLGG